MNSSDHGGARMPATGGCCSTRISVSLTHYTFLKKGDGGANTPIAGESARGMPATAPGQRARRPRGSRERPGTEGGSLRAPLPLFSRQRSWMRPLRCP